MNPQCVFLDRDGTINEDWGYTHESQELHLIEGAAEAIRTLNEHSIPVSVITNQSGVARGLFSESQVGVFHEALNNRLLQYGAHIDHFYYCPHHPDFKKDGENCDCRKPLPGMLHRAAQEQNLDLTKCVVVGDTARDIGAAHAAGSSSVLVLTGKGSEERSTWKEDFQPTHVTPNLPEAVAWILRDMIPNS